MQTREQRRGDHRLFDPVDSAAECRTVVRMAEGDPLWVFGYGSLMWNPGFAFERCSPATLQGYHRGFCVYCHHYRGTAETPGLVLGLMPGGRCRGMAFRVAADRWPETLAYLDERELKSAAYEPRTVTVDLQDSHEGTVEAHTYVANPTHRQYAGALPIEAAAEIIVDAQGDAGLNRDYLINTVRRLEADGYHDAELHALLQRVSYLTGIIEAGGGI